MVDRDKQQLGNYRLVNVLGRDGFEVYLGEHLYLETQAAIIVLRTELGREGIEQFRLTAKRIAQLEHPHIVRVLEFGVEGTTPFLVMSYAPEGTLKIRHPRGSRLPLPLIVQYVKQLADALQYAHGQQCIHGNVQPGEMLVGRRNEILLSYLSSLHSITSPVVRAIGTPSYMAPEQIQGHPTPASDQYALGVVVYEWLTGTYPFLGSSPVEIVRKQLQKPPPSLREQGATIPVEVEQVVMRALAKDDKQRFASVQAFASALEEASSARHRA